MPNELSPYLSAPGRLADVIAAIQTLATYKFYKNSFEGWADRISADRSLAEHWKIVFVEHPEFFRLDTTRTKASLVWRRQNRKRWQVDDERKVSTEDYRRMSAVQQERVSRTPLSPEDIKTLIDTAINLHARALETQKERRWWPPLAIGSGGAIVGSVIGPLVQRWLGAS